MSLEDWWGEVSAGDVAAVAHKAMEYGSADLDVMGEALVATSAFDTAGMSLETKRKLGQELALSFYLLGKVGRMFGAYANGRLPSDDTIHDATVYSMMLRRVRAEGAWPE